ncbi:MAG: hypothetical protein IKC21_02615, partial [Ruminococcus sp.]|nr:hypothetical protein [Ruminococcus sp.]
MKKVLAFLTALTALFCTACDNKQDSISENSPAEDITATTSAADISENTENPEASDGNTINSQPDTELKHYTINDFKEIEVKLNAQKTAPPVEFKEYDLSGIEFEAKKSPCTLPENVKIENICPDAEINANSFKKEFDEYCQQFLKNYAPIIESENKPIIRFTAFDGENLYYLGDYDIACPKVSHNFEIFRYNPETGENVSIYEYSDGTEGVAIADMVYNNGLFLFTLESEGLKTQKFDDKTGEFVDAADSFAGQVSVGSIDDPIYRANSYKKYIDLNMKLSDTNDYEVELARENGKITAKSNSYTLETGIPLCKKILSDENRLILLQSDNYYSVLHTFDFEKMEKYTTDLSSPMDNVNAYPIGKNVLIYYDYKQRYMYFVLELGAGFNLYEESSPTESLTSSTMDVDNHFCVDQSLLGISDNELAVLNFETLYP